MKAISPVLASAALETAPVGIVIIDDFGTIWFVNQEVVSLFGYPCEVLVGTRLDRILPGHRRHRKRRAEVAGLRVDGASIPVEIYQNPVADREPTLTTVMIVDAAGHARWKEEVIVAPAAANAVLELVQDQQERCRNSVKKSSVGG